MLKTEEGYGDCIAIIYSGKIIQQDTPEGILKNPKNELVRKLIAPIYILWSNKT